MSKKKQATLAKRKHHKALKRKNKTRIIHPDATTEERLSARLQRAIHQPHTRQYKEIPLPELLSEAKERIKDLRFLHYYLIFAKILCDKKLIEGNLKYNIRQSTFIIKAINESLIAIPKYDNDTAVQVELFDIGERMSELSVTMDKFITLLKPYQRYISMTIMKIGETLPERENRIPYEAWEIENEVLRIYAIDYIAEHIYNLKTEEGVVHE